MIKIKKNKLPFVLEQTKKLILILFINLFVIKVKRRFRKRCPREWSPREWRAQGLEYTIAPNLDWNVGIHKI
jgi:hypothetical protein